MNNSLISLIFIVFSYCLNAQNVVNFDYSQLDYEFSKLNINNYYMTDWSEIKPFVYINFCTKEDDPQCIVITLSPTDSAKKFYLDNKINIVNYKLKGRTLKYYKNEYSNSLYYELEKYGLTIIFFDMSHNKVLLEEFLHRLNPEKIMEKIILKEE